MDLIRFAVTNPVKIIVAVLLVVLFGFLSLFAIPVQLTPNVERPVITITTQWPGRSPEEVEKEIIEEQEDVLKNVKGLVKMVATASEGRAQIELEYRVGTDTNAARQEVSDSLREVPEYPDDVEEPVIESGDTGPEGAIAWLMVTAEEPNFDMQSIGQLVEDRVKPFLERTPDVASVEVYGGRDRQVHLEFYPDKMAQRGITYNALVDALRLQNTNVSAGDVDEGMRSVRVRTTSQFETLDQIRNTVVTTRNGTPIRIADLADVKFTLEERASFVRSRGQVSLAMPVTKTSEGNVIEVMEELKDRLERVRKEVLPVIAEQARVEQGLSYTPTLRIDQVYDETDYINDAIGLVQNNLVIGGLLAVVSLMLFLRSFRPTLVIALAIPISVVGTFVVMVGLGRNLNVISLAGLAFAVGMVVDAAIVVLENIDRHLGMGKKPLRAAYEGAREVWGAILASTLTTLVVFIPVIFIQEEAGQLFRDISIAICAAVTLSMIVAISVIPTMSSRLLVARKPPKSALQKSWNALFGIAPVLAWFTNRFADLLYKLTARNTGAVLTRIVIVLFFTLMSVYGSMLLMPKTDYLPRGNKNLVFGLMVTPPGYNMDQIESIGERVEARYRPYWEAAGDPQAVQNLPPIKDMQTQQPMEKVGFSNYFFVTFGGNVFNGATSSDKKHVEPVAAKMSEVSLQTVPGVFGFAQQQSIFGRGLSGSRGIDIEIVGQDLNTVRLSAVEIRNILMGMFGPFSVQPSPITFDKLGPEQRIEPDKVKASALGIDNTSLGQAVRAIVDGINVGDFRLSGDNIDIIAKRSPNYEVDPRALLDVPFAYTDEHGQVQRTTLRSTARERATTSPQEIRRVDIQRSVKLTLTPPDTMPIEAATDMVNGIVAQLRAEGKLPDSVQVNLEGSASKLAQVRETLLGEWKGFRLASLLSLLSSRIFIALLVTYLLMAALFESFVYPFVIMFTVPLATVGGFAGLAIVHFFNPGQMLDVLTMLGFVILIGVVVNNAILIVHQTLNYMRGMGESAQDVLDKMLPREALRESVRTRVRPVFMTTATSVFGMLPLVVMPGSGSELYRGLGSVVVGGLIMSTLFTLIVVPMLFSLVMDFQLAIKKARGGSEEELGQLPEINLDRDPRASAKAASASESTSAGEKKAPKAEAAPASTDKKPGSGSTFGV